MKINPVNFLVAIALSALLAFGLWSFDGELKNYVAVGAFTFLAGTLAPGIGVEFEFARRALNLRIVSLGFFVIGLVINSVFSLISLSSTAYTIVSTVAFLLYVLLANAIYSSKQ
jgi:energy-converting hydrogenase Eha subunit E